MTVDISVIICTRNRCESLKETLESLLCQENTGQCAYEVIVVDNNSTDRTKETVEGFIPKFNGRLRYASEPSPGLSFARNKGIQEARGTIVAFTDDDCIVDPRWISAIHACDRATGFDALGGKILPVYPPGAPEWIRANEDLLRGPIVFHDYGEGTRPYQKPMIEMVGANMAFRKKIFDDCGFFRTDLGAGQGTMGEDTDFIIRTSKKTKKIYYCGDVVIQHPVDVQRMTLRYLARWYTSLGRYRVLGDDRDKTPAHLTYYLGIPRYLIRKILQHGLHAIMNIFNEREFLKTWKQLFIDWGRAKETRKIRLSTKSS